MPLTDTAIRNAKSGPKSIKLFDGGGLYLEITHSGGKLWRLKYRHLGKEKRISLGAYPAVSLKEARERRDAARRQLAEGNDPSAVKQAKKLRERTMAASSFEAVAKEWFQRHLADKAENHRVKVIRRLERDVFPFIGTRPVAEIKPPEVLAVLHRIEQRGVLETAHRARGDIGQVMRYAIATGRAEVDPTPSLRGALPAYKGKHMAAPAHDPAAVGAILRSFDAFSGTAPVAAAVRLLPLLFCRPGELRVMRWEDVDLDASVWSYRVSKTDIDHIVPLSRQAVAILRGLAPITGHLPGGWVFIGGRSPMQPMSEAAINAAYRRLGIDTRGELTGHGWRAVARTMLHERLRYDPAVIEHQIAHKAPDASGLNNAYARTRFLEDRAKMMQAWGDYLDQLKAGAQIISLPGASAA
ncbi:MAG: integrase arm-type DNA-binding domain-containing protein [Betaproteobacteria bacterium]|nr:integrase arm-type DNA-binding domain-containing protein [Betaproteobacteria bacterium]